MFYISFFKSDVMKHIYSHLPSDCLVLEMLTVLSSYSSSRSDLSSPFSEDAWWPFTCSLPACWSNTCDNRGRVLRAALCSVNTLSLLLSSLFSFLLLEWSFLNRDLPLSVPALSEVECSETSSKWTERIVPMSVRRGGRDSLLWASSQLGSMRLAEGSLSSLDSRSYLSTGMSSSGVKDLEVWGFSLDPWGPDRLSFSSSSSRWLSFSTSSALWSSKPPL